jgi:hypothetical protein
MENMEMSKFLIDNGALASINTLNKVNIYMLVVYYIFAFWIVFC